MRPERGRTTLLGPLWRRAPLVPLSAPAWAAALAVAVATATTAAVSPALFVDAGQRQALSNLLAAVPEQAPVGERPAAQGSLFGDVTPRVDDVVTEAFDALPAMAPAVRTFVPLGYLVDDAAPRPVVRSEAGEELGVLLFRDGLVESLAQPADGPGTGVWLPGPIAAALDVGSGDTVEVGLTGTTAGDRLATVRVRGVYEVAPGSSLPTAAGADLSDLDRDLLPRRPDGPATVAPLVITDEQTYRSTTDAIGEQTLHVWRARLAEAGRDPAGLEAAASGVEELREDAGRPDGTVGGVMMAELGGPGLNVASGLPALAADTRRTATTLATGIGALAVAGVALGFAAIAAAAAALADRRRHELAVMAEWGVHPMVVGARSMIELAWIAVVGGCVGVAASWGVVGAVGPAAAPPRLGTDSVATAGLVVVAALTAAAATTTVVAWRAGRHDAGRAEDAGRTVPWRAVLVASALVAGAGVLTTDTADASIGLLAVAFPGLAIAAATTVVLGLARRPARTRQTARPRAGGAVHVGSWLLTTRLRSSGIAGATAIAVATALGLVTYAGVLVSSFGTSADARAAAIAGAPARVAFDGVPDGVTEIASRSGNTLVWTDRFVRATPGDQQVRLMAVDPATFAEVGAWRDGFVDDDVTALLDRLTRPSTTGVPVLLVGGAEIPPTGVLTRGEQWSAPFDVVGRPAAVPGVALDAPTVLVAAGTLFDAIPDVAPDSGADLFNAEVWSTAGVPDDLSVLVGDGAEVTTLEQVRNRPELTAQRWTLEYLLGLAAAIALLALAVAWLRTEGRHDERVISYGMMRRMGLRPSTHLAVDTAEFGALLLGGGAVGAFAGTAIARVMLPQLDVLADTPPPISLAGVALWVTATLVGAAGGALVLGVAAHLRAHRAELAPRLRRAV